MTEKRKDVIGNLLIKQDLYLNNDDITSYSPPAGDKDVIGNPTIKETLFKWR